MYPPGHRPWLGRGVLRLLDPRSAFRRLGEAWRVGSLRLELPGRMIALLGDVDAELEGVPALDDLSDQTLLARLEIDAEILAILHREEVLADALIQACPPTAASGDQPLK
jgi:hypothetical protein